jgi:hypothetical protein
MTKQFTHESRTKPPNFIIGFSFWIDEYANPSRSLQSAPKLAKGGVVEHLV